MIPWFLLYLCWLRKYLLKTVQTYTIFLTDFNMVSETGNTSSVRLTDSLFVKTEYIRLAKYGLNRPSAYPFNPLSPASPIWNKFNHCLNTTNTALMKMFYFLSLRKEAASRLQGDVVRTIGHVGPLKPAIHQH